MAVPTEQAIHRLISLVLHYDEWLEPDVLCIRRGVAPTTDADCVSWYLGKKQNVPVRCDDRLESNARKAAQNFMAPAMIGCQTPVEQQELLSTSLKAERESLSWSLICRTFRVAGIYKA